MFVLTPRGPGKGGAPSPARATLLFFGKLGLYFGTIRLAYIYFAGKESDRRATLSNN